MLVAIQSNKHLQETTEVMHKCKFTDQKLVELLDKFSELAK